MAAVPSPVIERVRDLGFPWPTRDPFLFCVYHDDLFPPGTESLGPDQQLLTGRQIGNDFGNSKWNMYHGDTVPGFPKHPHRGFETVSVVRYGLIDHSDSLGCSGRFGGGDVQWMTAGRGISHCEMFPLLDMEKENRVEMFQIWLNLPAANKMAEPHFKMLWNETIPRLTFADDKGRKVEVAVVAGCLGGEQPPKQAPPAPPPASWASHPAHHVGVFTIKLDGRAAWTLPAAACSQVLRNVYFFKGTTMTLAGRMCSRHSCFEVDASQDLPLVNTGDAVAELLVLQGMPINEPIVQHGPFVMNCREEILQAFRDYQRTDFGRWPHADDAPVHPRHQPRFARYADGTVDRPPAAFEDGTRGASSEASVSSAPGTPSSPKRKSCIERKMCSC